MMTIQLPVPIAVAVKESNRLGEIKFSPKDIFSLYEGSGEQSNFYILTDVADPQKIYMIADKGLWDIMFQQKGVRFDMNKL